MFGNIKSTTAGKTVESIFSDEPLGKETVGAVPVRQGVKTPAVVYQVVQETGKRRRPEWLKIRTRCQKCLDHAVGFFRFRGADRIHEHSGRFDQRRHVLEKELLKFCKPFQILYFGPPAGVRIFPQDPKAAAGRIEQHPVEEF